MEPNSIILIMAPILAPAAKKLGIDLVHFGIVIDVNMEVGLCHPPVGLNLYVASMIARMRITDLAVAVLPWLLHDARLPRRRDLLAGADAVPAAVARDALGQHISVAISPFGGKADIATNNLDFGQDQNGHWG